MIRIAIATLASISSAAAFAQKPLAVNVVSQSASPLGASTMGVCEMFPRSTGNSDVYCTFSVRKGFPFDAHKDGAIFLSLNGGGLHRAPVVASDRNPWTAANFTYPLTIKHNWQATNGVQVFTLGFSIATPRVKQKLGATLQLKTRDAAAGEVEFTHLKGELNFVLELPAAR